MTLYTDFSQAFESARMPKSRRLDPKAPCREPLAYISEKVQFYGCDLEINSSVLIPRQETELLVDKIVQTLKKHDLQGKILWVSAADRAA